MRSKLDDLILIQKAKQGDREAFGELMRRHQLTVMRTARLWTKTSEDAADVAQEVFLRAYKYLGQFNEEKKFINWLLKITTNTAKSWLKRKQRADGQLVPLEETKESILNQLSYEIYTHEDIQSRVRDAIALLSDKNRTAVHLHYICGYSYAEIGRQLNVPQSTVRSRLEESRKQLRKEFLSMVAALRLHENLTVKDGLAGDTVTAMFEDSKGNLWFGTTNGVSRYVGKKFQNFTTKDGLALDVVGAIFEDKEGNLWFGTGRWDAKGGGVSRYDGKKFQNFTTRDGLAGNTITAIFEDKQGNLWFGTWEGGISRYDGKTFHNINDGFPRQVIRLLFNIELKFQSDLDNGKMSEDLLQVFKNIYGIPISQDATISVEKKGSMWLITDKGFYVKKEENKLNVYSKRNNGVNAITQDADGNLWFGCYGGISRYDGHTFRHFTTKDGLESTWIEDILFDKDGNLWIARAGGGGGGLSKYGGKTFTNFPNSDGLPGDIVHSIMQDKRGNLWFGTSHGENPALGGASVYDGKSFRNFNTKHGLAHNVILKIVEDRNGTLWFATLGGGVSLGVASLSA